MKELDEMKEMDDITDLWARGEAGKVVGKILSFPKVKAIAMAARFSGHILNSEEVIAFVNALEHFGGVK